LQAAEDVARRTLNAAGFAGPGAAAAVRVARLHDLPLPPQAEVTADAARAECVAALPLLVDRRPPAGLLQIEALAPLGEAETLFLRSVADQLALALDRHAARLRDVQLRERAEALDRQ